MVKSMKIWVLTRVGDWPIFELNSRWAYQSNNPHNHGLMHFELCKSQICIDYNKENEYFSGTRKWIWLSFFKKHFFIITIQTNIALLSRSTIFCTFFFIWIKFFQYSIGNDKKPMFPPFILYKNKYKFFILSTWIKKIYLTWGLGL